MPFDLRTRGLTPLYIIVFLHVDMFTLLHVRLCHYLLLSVLFIPWTSVITCKEIVDTVLPLSQRDSLIIGLHWLDFNDGHRPSVS